jgi:hypothetical protein
MKLTFDPKDKMCITEISLPDIKNSISFLNPEEKYLLTKGAKENYDEYIRKEYVGFWNEEI